MQETTPPERASSAIAVEFKLISLLRKEGECGELVLPSLPLLMRRTEEKEELVCGRVRALIGNRKNNPVSAVSMWSLGGEGQGGGRGRTWQHSLPVSIEDNICSEPHLEVDTEELKTVPMQETGQT